jgi:hypothetical protein
MIYVMDDCQIYPKDEIRNLGVIFDSGLTMKPHVAAICQAAYYQLHNIWTIRRSLTQDAANKAITAFVMSKLDCGNALLYGLPKCTTDRLQRLQDCAARCLTGSNLRGSSLRPILKQLHWLPIVERVEYKLLMLTYKVLYLDGPAYLRDQISFYTPDRVLRSTASDHYLLREPKTELVSGGDRSFSKGSPVLWNSLPYDLRTCDSLYCFKKGVKTFLFTKVYQEVSDSPN